MLELLLASVLSFQTGGARIAWEIQAPSQSEAQGYSYKLYATDGTRNLSPNVTPVTCGVGPTTGEFSCNAPRPQLPAGNWTLRLTASSGGVESAPSNHLVQQFPPATPANLRPGQ